MRLSKKGNLVHGMWVERFETKDIRKANLPYPVNKVCVATGIVWKMSNVAGQHFFCISIFRDEASGLR
jgi:hypothetical protein